MPPEKKELDDFLKDIPSEGDQAKDILNEGLTPPAKEEPAKDAPEQEEEPRKNRRHRRWEAQLTEREKELIAREARIEALSEVGQFSKDVGDVDPRLLHLYGADDNGKQAAKLTQALLEEATTKAKDAALAEFREEQNRVAQEQRQYEEFIDSQLEDIEDEYNVDVTSNAPAARKARKEFLEVVQALSPKDENGTITGYADFSGAWEMYQLKRSQEKSSETSDRQKELADRSMEKSGNVDLSKAENDATLAFLRSQGIQV